MAQGPSNEGCDGVVVEVPDTDVYYPDRERVNVDVTSGKVRICLKNKSKIALKILMWVVG